MQLERQFPSSGHLVGCLQLHVFLLGSMMFFSIYYFCIMCFDDLLHISCAPIADLYVILVEQFIEFIVFWEVFSQKLDLI